MGPSLPFFPLLVPALMAQARPAPTLVPRYKPQPPYPKESRRLGEEGAVEVAFTVKQDGTVDTVRILKSPSERLSDSVQKTIHTWVFEPFELPNPGDRLSARVQIKFKMEG